MVNQSLQKEKAILAQNPRIYLVSACLLGLKTRYDGRIKKCPDCRKFLQGTLCIPICPEQLGGLSTPRTAADIIEGDGFDVLHGRSRVVNRKGVDVTEQFVLGAHQVLEIARLQEVDGILLKGKSPSCGLSPRFGVTAALLQLHGFDLREF